MCFTQKFWRSTSLILIHWSHIFLHLHFVCDFNIICAKYRSCDVMIISCICWAAGSMFFSFVFSCAVLQCKHFQLSLGRTPVSPARSTRCCGALNRATGRRPPAARSTSPVTRTTRSKSSPRSRCCGQHEPQTCRFIEAECWSCRKIGHIQCVCHSQSKSNGAKPIPKPRQNFKRNEARTHYVTLMNPCWTMYEWRESKRNHPGWIASSGVYKYCGFCVLFMHGL